MSEGRIIERVHEEQADGSYVVTGFLVTVPEGESGIAHFYFGPPGLPGPPLSERDVPFSSGQHPFLPHSEIFPGHHQQGPTGSTKGGGPRRAKQPDLSHRRIRT